MHLFEFLDTLLCVEDVEIVEAALPELFDAMQAECLEPSPGSALLEREPDRRGIAAIRFSDEQVEVLGHQDISDDDELVSLTEFFEDVLGIPLFGVGH